MKLGSNGFKNTLQILLFLIFNSFLAQKTDLNLAKRTPVIDSAAVRVDTLKTSAVQDSVQADSILKSEPLENVVRSKADIIKNDFTHRQTILEHNATIVYGNLQVDADYILYDWDKRQIFARGELDKNGKIISGAAFSQGDQKGEYESLTYDLKTRKAIAYNARTKQNEGVVLAQKMKKVNDSVYYLRRGKYTTDTYFMEKKDTLADYYLLAPRIKLVKGEKKSTLITGPIQMYIERVPTPFVLPFAILPFSDKRSAGILIPSFGERADVGFFLQGLGYYQPLGEHFDLKILADLYTKGSWNFRPTVNYRKRYKYSGSFDAEIGTRITGIKGLSNYSKSTMYRIGWSHRQASQANPYFNFSASVDIVSNKFYNTTLNNSHIFNEDALRTQQNSSVSFTKRFLNLPFTINGSASYNQNFATGLINLRLPQLTVNVNQFYLLKPKTGIRTGLLENIAVNTNLSLMNEVQTNEGELFTQAMFDKMKTGLRNTISIGTNTSLFKYFTFSLSANANNVVTTKTLHKDYNPITDKVEETFNKGIAGYSTFGMSASLQTVLYGMLKFNKDSKIQAIRHMVTPSISLNYSPDFSASSWGYYTDYIDRTGMIIPYSIFEQTLYGAPGQGLTKSIGFNINNNVEMKVRSKKDSTGVKKIKIFENLNISGSYNFAAEKYKWSFISVSTQSSFFKNKLRLNMAMSLDPYRIAFEPGSDVGVRTTDFGHFSVANFNAQLSMPLSEAIFGEKKDYAKLYDIKGRVRNEAYYFDEDHYAHFAQPWNLNISAQYSYSRGLSRTPSQTFSVGLNGNLNLTPYWSISGSTYYDVMSGKLAYTRLGFSRDQRSFSITFNWVPTGVQKVYDFFIGIKANILRDAIKYKSTSFQDSNSSF